MIILLTIFYMVIALIVVIIGYFVWQWLKFQWAILQGKWVLMKMISRGIIKEKKYSKLYLIFVILFAGRDTTDKLMKSAIEHSQKQEREGGPTCE